jgi:hypothetical protein
MTSAMMNLKRLRVIAGAGAVMAVLATTANAAQCRSVLDEDGDPVMLCGSTAYAADEDDDTGTEEYGDVDLADDNGSRDFEYDEDEGSLMVALENCEPGKFWMMETDEADDVPLPCR